MFQLTGRQIAAARRLLGWSTRDLAEKAGIAEAAVIRAEIGSGREVLRMDEAEAVFGALYGSGIRFGDPATGGGVKIDKSYRV